MHIEINRQVVVHNSDPLEYKSSVETLIHQTVGSFFFLDLSSVCRMVVYIVEQSDVGMLLQPYRKLVSSKSFVVVFKYLINTSF